jgi:hypothetical protein
MGEHESRPSYQLVRLQGVHFNRAFYALPAEDVEILVKAR